MFDRLGLTFTDTVTTATNFLKQSARVSGGLAQAALRSADTLLTGLGHSVSALASTAFTGLKAAGVFLTTLTTATYTTLTDSSLSLADALAQAASEAQEKARDTLTAASETTGDAATSLAAAISRSKTTLTEALNPSPTPDPRIPEHLRNHHYKEVQVRIATAAGQPLAGAELTLLSEPKHAVTDDQGRASFQDVPVGEHTLKIAFGTFRRSQTLFFNHDVPKLLVAVTPNVVEGVHPLLTAGIALTALLVGGAAMWFMAKKRFTGHFVV